MKKQKWYLTIISILLIANGVLWYLWLQQEVHVPAAAAQEESHEDDQIKFSKQQMDDLGISVKEAASGLLSIRLATQGKIILHPDSLAHILSRIPGVASEARKNIGDEVKLGEVMAVLESREMAEIKANYLAAGQKEKLSLSLFEREQKLYNKKISSEQDFLNAQAGYEEAKINTLLAAQKLFAFGITSDEIKQFMNQQSPDLRSYEIRSPLDGVVINRHITKGEFIDNTAPIYEVADLSRVWVEIGVYQKDLLRINVGQDVQVLSPITHLVEHAKIIFVNPIIQEDTINATAVAELPNPSRQWRPGMFVNVNITTEEAPAGIIVTKDAIQEINGKSYVFAKVGDGFEKRAVETGKMDNNNIEILAGLQQGQEYAAAKTFLLKAELGKSEVEDDD